MMKPRCSLPLWPSWLYFQVASGIVTTSPRIRSRSASVRYVMSCLADAREMGHPCVLGSMVAQTRFALHVSPAISQLAPSMLHASPSFSVVQSARLGSSVAMPHAGSPQVEYH